jgi:eukaryotic-like serine/threonine-protein kinase
VSDQRNVEIEAIGEEYMRQLKSGERISIAQFVANYPHLAGDLEPFLEALQVVDQFKPGLAETVQSDLSTRSTKLDSSELPEIGDYRMIREIGRGGMGIVYEAEQVSLGRHVALKMLPRDRNGDEVAVTRFLREARSAASLFHTNIVGVFEVHSSSNLHYYAMQFIEGTPP